MKNTVKHSLAEAARLLQTIPDIDAFFEAHLLLAHTMGKTRSWLFTWPEYELSDEDLSLFNTCIERRLLGEPVSYITNSKEFYGLNFKVSAHTLIPRPETELLVDTALEILEQVENARILELGTGSGAITAALATEKPNWHFLATEINEETLKVARHNFANLKIKADTLLSDWFENIPPAGYDLVISNPPYIESFDPHLSQGDLRFEPLQALASGEDGLEAIRSITAGCRQYLKSGGYLMLEHGYNQKGGVQKLFQAAGLQNIKTLKDFQENDRITIGRAK